MKTKFRGLGLDDLKNLRTDLLTEGRSLTSTAPNGMLEDENLTRFEEIESDVTELTDLIKRHEKVADFHTRGFNELGAPAVNTKTTGKPWEVRDSGDLDELRGRAVDTLSHFNVDENAIKRAVMVIDAQSEPSSTEIGNLARRITACASPDYTRAFMKVVQNPSFGRDTWTADEQSAVRAAMSVGTSVNGGYMVPTNLDPTIILTNAGSTNVLRQIARVITLTQGSVWHGISSAGVTASWDPEFTEVSDDSPTIADPTVTAYKAQQFVQWSIEAGEDISSLQTELMRLFADAKDRLEGAAYMNGTGSGGNQPTGIWPAIAAVSGSRVVSTTAATIGVVDLQNVYKALPQRQRVGAKWLMNPLYSLAIKGLGTAVSASFSGDLTTAPAGELLGKPVVESDDAPNLQTTTALDDEVLFGDFSNYVIVDKPGSMMVELVPHLFNTANNLPDGRRGLYAHWRTGGAPVNTDAWRLLVDKTSA